MKRKILLSLILLIILPVVISKHNINFINSNQYIKPINILNEKYISFISIQSTLNNQFSNVQVKIVLDSSWNGWNYVKQDGSDIRFTLDDGVTKIPYWIEEWNYTNKKAIIWVKIPELKNGENRILLLFGDQSLSPESNGEQVFDFFDDFNGNSLDTTKWTPNYVNTVNYEITNSNLRITDATKDSNTYWIYDNTDTGSQIKMNFPISSDMIIEWKEKMEKQTDHSPLEEVGIGFIKSDKTFEVYYEMCDYMAAYILYHMGHESFIGTTKTNDVVIQPDTYYIMGIKKEGNNYEMYYYNGSKIIVSGTGTTSNQISYITIGVGVYGGYPFNPIDIDWVRVRKYLPEEPVVKVSNEIEEILYESVIV